MKHLKRLLPWIILAAAVLCLSAQAASGETVFRALLIGIDNYQNNPLEGCVQDASRMASTLQAANEAGAFYQTPVIRSNLQSTEILALSSEIDDWNVDEDDVTFFYYAGCGFLGDRGTAAIVGKDSKMIPLSDLRERLLAIPGVKILVLDCRYTDSLITGGESASETLVRFNNAVLDVFSQDADASSHCYVLSAATLASSEAAALNPGQSAHGLVTYALTKGLGYDYDAQAPLDALEADSNHNDAVSLAEAVAYVEEAVRTLKAEGKAVECAVGARPAGSAYPMLSRRATADVLDVTLSRDHYEVPAGKTVQVEATTQPANASLRTLGWTSEDQSIATIDGNGVVAGVRPGTVRIAATTANGLTRFATVEVKDVKFVESMEFTAGRISLAPGAEIDLGLKVVPDYANEAITWSVADPSVATVDQSGHVTFVALGNTYVTARSDNGVEATCSIQVVDANKVVTDFRVNKTELNLYEGETFQFENEFKPDDATDLFVTFVSADDSVVTVDGSDLATAEGVGETTILATASSGLTQQIQVRVKAPTIALNKSALSLRHGKTAQLKARIEPETLSSQVVWTSSDESVATVENGKVTAIAAGECAITAAIASGESAQCTVAVDAVIVKKIAVKPTEVRLDIGAQRKIDVRTKPDNAQGLKWESSDTDVAIVDDQGNVTALAPGDATIRVTAGSGKSAACKVHVNPIAVSELALSQHEVTLIVGMQGQNTVRLEVTTNPPEAGRGSLKWQTDKSSVARVDSMGNVTAVNPGTCRVRVSAASGSRAYDTCTVKVEKNSTINKKPLAGDEARLYTSARKIAYENSALVIDLWYYNAGKKAVSVPVAGTLMLTLSDGTEYPIREIKAGSKRLKPGKSGHLSYKTDLKGHPELSGLDLRGASATIVTQDGSTAAEDASANAAEPASLPMPDAAGTADLPPDDDEDEPDLEEYDGLVVEEEEESLF